MCWRPGKELRSPAVGCSAQLDTMATRDFQQLHSRWRAEHMTLATLTARILKVVNFFFYFIWVNVYSIPFVPSAETVLHHGPCREGIPLSAEGGLIKVPLFPSCSSSPYSDFLIWILCQSNLYSTVCGAEMCCLTNSDEFHPCLLPFWHHQLPVWLPWDRYFVLYLSSVISSQACWEEKRYNFSGVMHTENEQEILDSSSVWR